MSAQYVTNNETVNWNNQRLMIHRNFCASSHSGMQDGQSAQTPYQLLTYNTHWLGFVLVEKPDDYFFLAE